MRIIKESSYRVVMLAEMLIWGQCRYLIPSLTDTGGAGVGTIASQQERSGFCVEFACSPCVYVGSLQVLRLRPTVQVGKHTDM